MPDSPSHQQSSTASSSENKQDGISPQSTEQAQSHKSNTSSDNIACKDAARENADVEAGLRGGVDGDRAAVDNNNDCAMRGRQRQGAMNDQDRIGRQWRSPLCPDEDHTNPQYFPPALQRLFTSILALPIIKPVASYISGPSRLTSSQPRLWNIRYIDQYIERPLFRYTKKWTRHPLVLWGFLIAWFLGFTFLARAAWWNSGVGGNVQWLSGTSTYWQRNDGCGLDGQGCAPFDGFTVSYRCPSKVASTRLLNYRTIGNQEVIYQPLVVGGGDELGTYRADSFICSAAVHRGLFTNEKGGCLTLQAIGSYTNFLNSTQNGISSTYFDSEFPFAYRFVDTSQKDCRDLRDDILIYNTVMSTAFGLLVRASAGVFYWVSVCFGFWHVTLASDPREFPPDLAGAFGSFLPTLFFSYAFYRFAYRWVLPAFNNRIFERTIWFYGPFWVFLLSNYTLDRIPIDRLTASDIKQQAGGIAAIVVLVIVLVIVAINQVRVVRLTGWLPYYLGWYIVGGLIILILSQLPGLVLRIHHYIAALCLIPATAFPTRASLIYQGILLGLFLNGAARWGFDSILQTVADVRRDAALGSDLPAFNLTSIDVSTPVISWSAIPDTLTSSWDGFALMVNDVLRYTGQSTNFTMPTTAGNAVDDNTASSTIWRTDIPYYLRLSYTSAGSSGDFTKAATAWLSNGTFIAPQPGPS